MKKTVSVIVPVFNDQASLDKCLEHLSIQKCPQLSFEVIVVDNCSNPAITIASQFSTFASLVVCEKAGSYAARNAGVRHSYGEYIAFTDADCKPDKYWLERGINSLEANVNAIIGGQVIIEKPHPRTGTGLYQYLVGFQQDKNILINKFSVTANLFCRRATFETTGPFDENLMSGGDREWCWRAQRSGLKIIYNPESIVYTPPRTSLRSAIRQARRVAAGRIGLHKKAQSAYTTNKIKPYRPPLVAISWILQHDDINTKEKIKVLLAAIAIKAASYFEILRIKIGGKPERR